MAPISPLRLLLAIAVTCALGWVVTRPGGASGWWERVVEQGRDLVVASSEDPSLRDAHEALNERFARDGVYPFVSDSLVRDDPTLAWGVGASVTWCQPRAVVITGMTGGGTISRLLVDGEVVGDVPGRASCPFDLANPAPWTRD